MGDANDPDEALECVEQIRTLIEDELGDQYDKATDFFDDILAKSQSVGETIERTGRATARQRAALASWEAAVRKWIKD